MAVTVRVASILGLAKEAYTSAGRFRHELGSGSAGSVSVSGVLAEQLARELDVGARSGAVRVGGDAPSSSADVVVRVIAGDPTDADLAFVRVADRTGIPVVLVQLWPQADWTRPFVLSPHVVECRAGEGFPLRAIADRIVDATDHGSLLASDIPSLRPSVQRRVVLQTVVRAAALGALGGRRSTRPLIAAEQMRMIARLSAATGRGGTGVYEEPAALAGVTGIVLASGLALRSVARTARLALPSPVANSIVAAAGTWALAQATKLYAARGSS